MGKHIDAIKAAPTETYDRLIAQTRAHYFDRWRGRMAELGRAGEEIDYTDPYIHIEWLLCDLNNLHDAKSKKLNEQARWYAKLTTKEIEVFDNEYKEPLSKKSLRQEITDAVRKRKKG